MLAYYPEGSPHQYEEARPEPVVLLFESGVVLVPSAETDARARELIREPIDRLADLDLLEVPSAGAVDVETAPTVMNSTGG